VFSPGAFSSVKLLDRETGEEQCKRRERNFVQIQRRELSFHDPRVLDATPSQTNMNPLLFPHSTPHSPLSSIGQGTAYGRVQEGQELFAVDGVAVKGTIFLTFSPFFSANHDFVENKVIAVDKLTH